MLTCKTIQEITQGDWIVPPFDLERVIKGGSFDTRNIDQEEIFFAWKGENGDGHEYLSSLAKSSIKLIIVEKEVSPVNGIAILKVKNSLKALHVLAQDLANKFQGTIIALTGSSGKTTAKAWLGHILERKFKLLQNAGTFNNHIGCPITLLNLEQEDEIIVLEMGTSGLGELELLTSVAPADISLLLNVGRAHLGKFGSLEKTYQAKLEIFTHQRNGAISLIPFGDNKLKKALFGKKLHFFGKGSGVFDWSLQEIDTTTFVQEMLFHTPWGEKNIALPVIGPHVGETLSALLTIAHRLGMDWEEIAPALQTLPQEKGRNSIRRGKNDCIIIDDSYNANPDSIINLLQTLAGFEMMRKIAVIGNMAEMEPDLEYSATFMLENTPETLDEIFLIGETSKILYPLWKRKMPNIRVHYCEKMDELIRLVTSKIDSKTIIGVKGSRSAHMERIVWALLGEKSMDCNLIQCGKLTHCSACNPATLSNSA